MLELLLFSQLFLSIKCKIAVFPYYRGAQWKCRNRNISIAFLLTERGNLTY